jgi:hypothetical protein
MLLIELKQFILKTVADMWISCLPEDNMVRTKS